jgi:hypothetical protein
LRPRARRPRAASRTSRLRRRRRLRRHSTPNTNECTAKPPTRSEARHGTPEDYDREVAPLNREFAARSAAIVAISAALYGAAAVNDATGDQAAARSAAARQLLVAITNTVDILERGNALPRVPIPPEVAQIIAGLRGIAAQALADGGTR